MIEIKTERKEIGCCLSHERHTNSEIEGKREEKKLTVGNTLATTGNIISIMRCQKWKQIRNIWHKLLLVIKDIKTRTIHRIFHTEIKCIHNT